MSSIFQRKIITAVLVLVLFWLGQGVYRLYYQRAAETGQLRDMEAKVAGLKSENDFLASASAYFNSDAYLERQARIKLNYKLPDEEVAFVYRASSPSATMAPSAEERRVAEMSTWRKWLFDVFGY